jgi:hypothetical protein
MVLSMRDLYYFELSIKLLLVLNLILEVPCSTTQRYSS